MSSYSCFHLFCNLLLNNPSMHSYQEKKDTPHDTILDHIKFQKSTFENSSPNFIAQTKTKTETNISRTFQCNTKTKINKY